MNLPFFKSLRFRMPLLVLSGIIPLIALAIIVASDRASKTIEEESKANLILKTKLLSESIKSWNKSNVLSLLNLNKQPDIIARNIESQKIILSEMVNTYEHLYIALTIDLDGWDLARSDGQESKYYAKREYFKDALEGNPINYQTLIGKTNKKPSLCLSSPIKKQEVIQGVTVICSDLESLAKQVGKLKFGNTGYAFIVDSKGSILAHPNTEYISGMQLKNYSEYPPVKNVLQDRGGYLSFQDSQGKNWVSYTSKIDNGWSVVVLQEQQEFFDNKRKFEHLSFFIGLVTILGTSGLTLILANRLVQPIADLTGAAQTIARGKLDNKVQINRQDELGILASSFNQMASQLNTYFEELEQAKESAISANHAKDRFIGNISHELRSPLNGIIGYAKILKRELPLDKRQTQEFEIIEESGLHLLTLINDLLDFSKNQANKMKLNPNEVNLPNFLKGIIGIVSSEAKQKGLEVICTFKNLPDSIEADEKRLRQILINLLNNAIKFTERGRVILKVTAIDKTLDYEQKYEQKIRFEVIDTGVGISQVEQSKIFQPFEQADQARLKNVGTGLGLSISQQLVRLMGGTLQVKSKLGQGSNFWFEAAFSLRESKSSWQKQTLKIENLSGYQGKEKNILIVDDLKANRWLLVDLLEPLGFKVLTADNGEAMFDLLQTLEKPDLICLDLFMPNKTGFTSLKQLRKIPNFKNIPIIVISATSITEEMREYLQCDAFLNKPLEEEKLLNLLQELLNLEWTYKIEDNTKKRTKAV